MRQQCSSFAGVVSRFRLDAVLVALIIATVLFQWNGMERDLEELSARRASARSTALSPKAWVREKVEVAGTVISPPQHVAPGIQRFGMRRDPSKGVSETLLVKAPDMPWESLLESGTEVIVKGVHLLPPPSSFARFLLSRGYSAYLLAHEVRQVKQLPPTWLATRQIGLMRRYGDRAAYEVIAAEVFGAKDQVSKSTKELFRDMGCSHLLVVSGFHVALIYGVSKYLASLIFSFASSLFQYFRKTLIVNGVAFLSAILYCALCGFSVSVSRALVVLSLFVCAECFGRKTAIRRSILLSFLAVQLIWPGSLFEAGCQLTFAAIIGILVFCRRFSLRGSGGICWSLFRKAYNMFLVGFGAWFASSPIVALWFANFVPLSPIWNLILTLPFCLFFVLLAVPVTFYELLDLPFSGELMNLLLFFASVFIEAIEHLDHALSGSILDEIELSTEFVESYGVYWILLVIASLIVLSCNKRGAEEATSTSLNFHANPATIRTDWRNTF